MKRLIPHILLSLAACAFNANAAIINADTAEYNAYQDTETGLFWLDFGENNNQSYNYVASQLGDGGEWAGWRLPTVQEVYTMWANVADLGNVVADFESADFNGPGQLYAYDSNSDVLNGDDSVFDPVFAVIGYNTSTTWPFGYVSDYALGWFAGTSGLSFVDFSDYSDNATDGVDTRDVLQLNDTFDYDYNKGAILIGWSTLLVRASVTSPKDVPAPSTVSILILGLLGLVARRKLF